MTLRRHVTLRPPLTPPSSLPIATTRPGTRPNTATVSHSPSPLEDVSIRPKSTTVRHRPQPLAAGFSPTAPTLKHPDHRSSRRRQTQAHSRRVKRTKNRRGRRRGSRSCDPYPPTQVTHNRSVRHARDNNHHRHQHHHTTAATNGCPRDTHLEAISEGDLGSGHAKVIDDAADGREQGVPLARHVYDRLQDLAHLLRLWFTQVRVSQRRRDSRTTIRTKKQTPSALNVLDIFPLSHETWLAELPGRAGVKAGYILARENSQPARRPMSRR